MLGILLRESGKLNVADRANTLISDEFTSDLLGPQGCHQRENTGKYLFEDFQKEELPIISALLIAADR